MLRSFRFLLRRFGSFRRACRSHPERRACRNHECLEARHRKRRRCSSRTPSLPSEPSRDRQAFPAESRIDSPTAILIPGLINTHTHAPMSLLRGIADDMRAPGLAREVHLPGGIQKRQPDFVRWGTRLACAEMLLSGYDNVHGHVLLRRGVAEATKECGMRAVLGQTIIGFPCRTPKLLQTA